MRLTQGYHSAVSVHEEGVCDRRRNDEELADERLEEHRPLTERELEVDAAAC